MGNTEDIQQRPTFLWNMGILDPSTKRPKIEESLKLHRISITIPTLARADRYLDVGTLNWGLIW